MARLSVADGSVSRMSENRTRIPSRFWRWSVRNEAGDRLSDLESQPDGHRLVATEFRSRAADRSWRISAETNWAGLGWIGGERAWAVFWSRLDLR